MLEDSCSSVDMTICVSAIAWSIDGAVALRRSGSLAWRGAVGRSADFATFLHCILYMYEEAPASFP